MAPSNDGICSSTRKTIRHFDMSRHTHARRGREEDEHKSASRPSGGSSDVTMSRHKQGDNEQPWVEKHRPCTLQGVAVAPNQTSIHKLLQTFAKERMCPPILASGAPGIGKTTILRCLAHQLTMGDRSDVLALNASMDRGAEAIRRKVVPFVAQQGSASNNEGQLRHRVVFLDEGDSLTEDAQHALVNIIRAQLPHVSMMVTCSLLERCANWILV